MRDSPKIFNDIYIKVNRCILSPKPQRLELQRCSPRIVSRDHNQVFCAARKGR
jgi:hypothetical protein